MKRWHLRKKTLRPAEAHQICYDDLFPTDIRNIRTSDSNALLFGKDCAANVGYPTTPSQNPSRSIHCYLLPSFHLKRPLHSSASGCCTDRNIRSFPRWSRKTSSLINIRAYLSACTRGVCCLVSMPRPRRFLITARKDIACASTIAVKLYFSPKQRAKIAINSWINRAERNIYLESWRCRASFRIKPRLKVPYLIIMPVWYGYHTSDFLLLSRRICSVNFLAIYARKCGKGWIKYRYRKIKLNRLI